jgi:ribosome biogenesis GTPase A
LGWSAQQWQDTPDDAALEAIARKRGAIASGGHVNGQKAAELLIADFRSQLLGRITLESPQEFGRWLAAGLKADAQRQSQKKERPKAPRRKR